jgi:hypothetical protein
MKLHINTRPLFSLFVIGFALATLSASAFSADMPKRKSGLWEINMTHERQ